MDAKLYDKVLGWVMTYGPRILLAIALLVGGMWLVKVMRNWMHALLEKRRIDLSLRSFLQSLLSTVLYVLLVMAVMQVLGLQMTMFAALVGGIGVATGLALSGTLQNFTSGILILLLKPFRVSDNIVAQTFEGTVSSIQIFHTVLITFDNRSVIIPNSKLSNELIVNLSRKGTRRLDIELKFGFAQPFEQVRQSIQKTIDRNADMLKEPVARVGVSGIDPDGYRVWVNVWVHAHGFIDKHLALNRELIEGLRAEDIKLPGT